MTGQQTGAEGEVVEFLRGVDFLGGVSEASLRRVAGMLEPREYQPGQVVFGQGEPGEEVLLIRGGWIEVGRESPGGAFRRFYSTGPGDAAGILSFMGNTAHSATGRAEERVSGLALSRSRKQELLSMPDVMLKLLLVFEARRRQMLDMSVDLQTANRDELEYRIQAYEGEIAQVARELEEVQRRLERTQEQLAAHRQELARR